MQKWNYQIKKASWHNPNNGLYRRFERDNETSSTRIEETKLPSLRTLLFSSSESQLRTSPIYFWAEFLFRYSSFIRINWERRQSVIGKSIRVIMNKKTRGSLNYRWSLPGVTEFNVVRYANVDTDYFWRNWVLIVLYLIFGINLAYRDYRSKLDQEIRSMNRKLGSIYTRARKYRDQKRNRRYFNFMKTLIIKSDLFILFAITRTETHWYRVWTLDQLTGIIAEVKERRKLRKLDLLFSVQRVHIPKDINDTSRGTRPLSIPPTSMRIILQMMNIALVTFTNVQINKHQHGHRPGKGVGTAWIDIIRNILCLRNISEFDFTKFHDRISYLYIKKALRHHDVPHNWIQIIIVLNNPWVRENGKSTRQNVGVGQGLATSAILGIIVLELLEVYSIKDIIYLGYADDGLLGSNNDSLDLLRELEKKLIPASGVLINISKSGIIKKGGKWLKSFKFLGIRFDPFINLTLRLRLDTRSGKIWNIWIQSKLRTYHLPLDWQTAFLLGYFKTILGQIICIGEQKIETLVNKQNSLINTFGIPLYREDRPIAVVDPTVSIKSLKIIIIYLKSGKWSISPFILLREPSIKIISQKIYLPNFNIVNKGTDLVRSL